ncbi:unnamed protein product [Caenorhabditis auriculariae]|uniref:Carboxypeptidase n=1 Tax=Caenorhabditis auriculariae TaxID=2777116 RepID=A0A8S1GVJ1_9PELO|nr:unnamed protein product [Caenorhabditis auriculariae]
MRRHLGAALLFLAGLAIVADAAKSDDLVRNLPGLTYYPNFNQYSGYLNGSPGNYLHYWLVEAQTNPDNAPLVLWLNGGPGCSSLLGILTENGPFRANQDGSLLVENPHSWNKAANVLYLESPRDIGFSYRDNATYGPDTLYNDVKTASDNALALVNFFQAFPEYNGREFYITGESYGGVYVPTLTQLIIQMIQNNTLPNVNLVGMAVGNGALSRKQLTNSAIDLLFYRGMLGVDQYEALRQCCPETPLGPLADCDFSKFVTFDSWGDPVPLNNTNDATTIYCGKMVADLSTNAVWATYNDVYNSYQDCYNFTGTTQQNIEELHRKLLRKTGMRTPSRNVNKLISSSNLYSMFSTGSNPFVDQGALYNRKSTDALQGYACYAEDGANAYLNRADVRAALNIPLNVQAWQSCNDAINEQYYIQQTPDTTYIFKFFVDSEYPLKVLIYNGDVDLACNFLGDQWFIENLATSTYQFNLITNRTEWDYTRPGGYASQLAGYVKSWSYKNFAVDLLTVAGGGHMVPMDRPGPALQMFYNFLFKKNYNQTVPYSLSTRPLRAQYAPVQQKSWTRKQADRVWNLPGVTYGLNFKQYSGYLNGVTGNYLHYWFVESQNNPTSDPLVLWLTGGPGCSSLLAFLTELGPFHPNPDGKTLFENVYSWNKGANVIFLESPRGVGFSVQDRNLNNDTIYDDDRTAWDTFLALKDFFTVYPEYEGRPFFVTGESYGGVYVPTLTSLLIDQIQAGNFPQLNLVGMSVGNGELSSIQQFNSAINMGYFHGLYGKEEWDSLQQCCNSSKTNSQWFEYCNFAQYVNIDTSGSANPIDNSFCAQKVADLGQARFWNSLNLVYNIYQDCYEQTSRPFGSVASKNKYRGFVDQGAQISMSSTDNQGGFLCYATAGASNYLDIPDVRDALHVSPQAGNWTPCVDDINNNYVQQHNDTTSVFQHMIDSGYPLRVLIYNGDVDQACNYLGDQWFVENVATKNNMAITKNFDAWRYMTQIAGYAKKFDNNAGFTIDLLTVKGAGHMVPTDRPGPALQMITNFFRNQDYSNPTVFDYSLHPLKPAYRIAQRVADNVNANGTSSASSESIPRPLGSNRKNIKAKKIERTRKIALNLAERKRLSFAAFPPPPDQTKAQDEVINLPGLTFQPNFKHYSGYLKASTGNYLHYWLTESQSSPATDPLILWLNGGPGCSSLGGLLEELGPFHINPDGQTVFENVFAWNKAGNVLFLEAPRGVGFSYRSNEVPADSLYNDTYTASDTVLALQSFFTKFPEYKGRPFYITGESYGGIYVPTLTSALIKKIQSTEMSYVNLVGIGIGNGEMSEIQQVSSSVSLLYFRGEHGKNDWDALSKCCDTSKPQAYCDFISYITLDTFGNAWPKVNDNSTLAGQCGNLVVQQGFLDVWTTDNDVYNTFMDCYAQPGAADSKLVKTNSRRVKRSLPTSEASVLPPLLSKPLFIDQATKLNYGATDANGGFACTSGDSAESYLNLPAVRQALHIPDFFTTHWSDCNDDINENYIQQHNDTSSVFVDILQSNYKLKFLIYNGDVDMACQFLGDQWFIEKLAKDNNMAFSKPHNPWNYTQGQYLPRIGGYVKQFNYNNSQATFDLLTVKGAGHFVPQDRPGPSLQMIYNFVNNLDYSRNLTLDISRKPLLPQYTSSPTPVYRNIADHIFQLPGLTFQYDSGFHAGYLKASPGNYLYYWLVESQADTVATDPVVLWLQGGPGCASTGGLFGEVGPFFVNPDGKSIFENVYSWNKAATILVIDSPRGVGFSYQDKSVNQDNKWDDTKTASDTALALEDFFTAYPFFMDKPFYVAGESYGGIYVPTLTRLLIQRIQAGQSKINLQGMLVGNGLLSSVQDVRTLPDFLYAHGIYDKPQWEELHKCCQSTDQSGSCNYDQYITIDQYTNVNAKKYDNATLQNCANLVEQLSFDRNWRAMYDQYNLYQDCYTYPQGNSNFQRKDASSRLKVMPNVHKNMQASMSPNLLPSVFDPLSTDATGGYSCYQYDAITRYLAQPHVRDAIHVPDFVQRWEFCTDINYASLYNDTTQIFVDMFNSGYNLKVLVYNGDVDTVCSMFEAQNTIHNFAIQQGFKAPQPRSAWMYAQQIAGYVQKYQNGNMTIDLVTVKGAGHGVPVDRPGPSQQLVYNFISGQPNYNTSVPFDLTRKPLLPQYTETGAGAVTVTATPVTNAPVTSQGPSNSTGSTNPPSTTAPTTAPIPTTTRGTSKLNIFASVAIAFVSFHQRPFSNMQINAIVYNKTRKLAGHTFKLELNDNATVAEAKQKIEELTTVPHQIQWVVFGTEHLEDEKMLREYGIRDGYTIYSTPTYVEIQDMPNL